MSTSAQRTSKVALVAGFLALAVASWVAHQNPATGYELSIYAATPATVWAGLAVAFAAGGVVALTAPRAGRAHDAALLLVAASALLVFALPLVRGYEFYGAGDALTHLGWASEIAAGTLSPTELLYPGLHTMTVLVANATGLPLRHANLYLVLVAFPLVFLLFVPLTVQLLGGGKRALAVGLLAAALFVPINNVSVHPVAHPASQGILFLAFVLYLVLAYTARPATQSTTAAPHSTRLRTDGGSRLGRVTSLGALLALTSAAIVLLHPQQALNVALVFVAVAAIQAAYRWWQRDGPITSHRPVFAQTALLVVLFAAWAPRFERVSGTVTATFGSIFRQGATAGDVVASKSTSLTTVGGSLLEVFLKLFFPALVLSVVAIVFAVAVLWRRDDRTNHAALVTYLTAALVPLFGVFVLMLAAQVGDQYFRYQGFIMVPVTVLAATALARLVAGLNGSAGGRTSSGRRTGTVLAVVLFLVLVPAGAVALHPSPYMYQPNSQVTETDFSGYAASFEHRDADIPFVGVRSGPRRFVDYHYGTEYATETLDFPGDRAGVGEERFTRANYSTSYEVPRYFPVTRSTYQTEVFLYDGFRYPASGFAALDATVGVDRVRSSDSFTLYRLPGEE